MVLSEHPIDLNVIGASAGRCATTFFSGETAAFGFDWGFLSGEYVEIALEVFCAIFVTVLLISLLLCTNVSPFFANSFKESKSPIHLLFNDW